MFFLPIVNRLHSIEEIKCFLKRVVLQNGNLLLTEAKSRVPLSNQKCNRSTQPGYHWKEDRLYFQMVYLKLIQILLFPEESQMKLCCTSSETPRVLAHVSLGLSVYNMLHNLIHILH